MPKFRYSDNIKSFVNPPLLIGGIEVSDLFLRFSSLRGRQPYSTQIPLLTGTVIGGIIKNKTNFLSALRELRARLPFIYRSHGIVATVSSSAIKTRIVSTPAGASDESRRLAIQLAIPAGTEADEVALSSVRLINSDANREDFFTAFFEKSVISDYQKILAEAGFNAVAFEFPAVSLSRLAYRLSRDSSGMVGVAAILDGGLVFAGSFLGQTYFSHFISWSDLQSQEGGTGESHITDAFKRILDFYAVKFSRPLSSVVVFAPRSMPDLKAKISEAISVKVQQVSNWSPATGAALRNLWPSDGNEVNFFQKTSLVNYFFGKLQAFSWQWGRNFTLALSALAMLLVLFIFILYGVEFLFRSISSPIASEAAVEFRRFKDETLSFNFLVDGVSSVLEDIQPVSHWLRIINNLSSSKITVEKISFNGKNSVVLTGRATNEAEAINFRKRLEEDKNFSEIVMPLSSLTANRDGTVSFTANFQVL